MHRTSDDRDDDLVIEMSPETNHVQRKLDNYKRHFLNELE